MLRHLLKRRQRNGWEALQPTLTWWRTRYADPAKASRGLQTIAANLPHKLMVIAWDSTPLPTLWIGLPAGQAWSVEALQPYGVWLSSAENPPTAIATGINGWRKVAQWPTATTWLGLLAYDHLYINAENSAENTQTDVIDWPTPNGQHAATWQLPTPVLGTATQLVPVPVRPLPAPLSAESDGLYLGRNADAKVYAPARVQVWGDRHTLHRWTIQLLLHELTNHASPLVVIDGYGDMAAQLPLYKPFVAALKAAQLHYVNMEDDLRQQGFNPLQPLEWETVQQTADRWQRWLDALGIWPSGVWLDKQAICLHAVDDGVDTLSTLTRWFHDAEDIPQTSYVYIQRALRQVQKSATYAVWLRRPRPIFERPQGLVFACATNRDPVRRTMTAALLDAALTLPNVTLVLTGMPTALLQAIPNSRLPRRVVMVNGVRLAGSLVGICRIADETKRRSMVVRAFGKDDAALDEIVEQLTIAPSDTVCWLTNPSVLTIC